MKNHRKFKCVVLMSLLALLLPAAMLRAAMTPPGNALAFNGTTQYVNIPDANSLDLTTNYTLECWFKADSFGGLRCLISKYQTGGANGYLLRLTGTELDFDQMATSGLNLQAGQWYHVAAVNSGGTRHLYVNGVEKTLSGTATTVAANTDPLRLASEFGSRYFAGQLDEVRIWNTARTQAEIQQGMYHTLTGSETGLVTYYQFDQTTGTTLPDLTTNANTGTLVAAPAWTASGVPVNYALSFNGTNQYVNIPDTNSLDMTTNYTLECWFKADSFGSLRGLIDKYQTSGSCGYLLRLNGTELEFDELKTSGLSLQTGQWYHVAAVNGGGTRHLYVNGVEKTISGTGYTVVANTNDLRLGCDYGNRFFAGQLDEARIWNTVRTQAQIQDAMHQGLDGSETGLVAYYRFNQGGGTALTDATAHANTGTLVNSPTWSAATVPFTNIVADSTNVRGAWIANPTSLASSRLSIVNSSETGTNFAVFGHDNGADAWQSTDVPAGVAKRLTRSWRTEASGSVTGDIRIDTTGLADPGDGSMLRLLVDGDGVFSNATIVAGSYSAPYYTVAAQSLPSGANYTLALSLPPEELPISDGFEAAGFSGWVSQQVNSTQGAWIQVSSGSDPPASPHTGSYMAKYNSYSLPKGTQTRLYRTVPITIPASSAVTLSFWIVHYQYQYTDEVQPQISLDGSTWNNVGNAAPIYVGGGTGWAQINVDLSAYSDQSTVYLGFLGISDGCNFYLDDVSVTSTPLPPTATTTSATQITSSGATLNGGVNARGSDTTVTFEYGLTTDYGTTVGASPSLVTGSSAVAVSAAISGLSANTVYHYRVKGESCIGITYGNDLTFTTTTGGTVILINDGFESSGFGGWSTRQVNGTDGAWSQVGSGTLPTASPHGGTFMAKFNSYNAAEESQTRLYRTVPLAISASYPAATLHFWMYHDPNDPVYNDRVQPQISLDGSTWTNIGTTVSRYAASAGWAQVSVDLGAYIGQSTVYLGFLGISGGGYDIYLDDVTVTNVPLPPSVSTNSAAKISSAGATLNGTVNAHGVGTTVTFEYGISTAYGTATGASTSPVTGSSAVAVSAAISGLSASTLYHYRVKGESSGGITCGNDLTFTTTTGNNELLVSDGFEVAGFSDWATRQVIGTDGAWSQVSSGTFSTASPHGGGFMAKFNSTDAGVGSQTRLYRTAPFAIPASSANATLLFWMYHDPNDSLFNDRVQPQVSLDGSTWTNVGTAVSRYAASAGWVQVSVDLSTYSGQSTVYLGFLGISDYGYNIYLDDVSVGDVRTGYDITASATEGGSISPNGIVAVPFNGTKQFTITTFSGYSFDGLTGTCPAGSMSGNTYTTGTITADCTLTANFTVQHAANALGFNGTSQCVDLGTSGTLALTGGAFTIEAWIKPTEKASCLSILGRKPGGSANPGYAFYVNTYNSSDARLKFETQGANCGTADPVIAWNIWQHVAVTWDGTTLRFYVNGVEKTASGSVDLTDGNVRAMIGAFSPSGGYYPGMMDELRVWNVTRTAADLRDAMHNQLSGGESGLAAYYQFNQAAGTTLPDLSANHLNGTLVSSPTWTTATTPLANVIASKTNIRGAWIANTNTLASSRLSVASASVTGTNFAVFGHDNGTDVWQTTDVPGTVNSRLGRVWRAEVSGSATGTIKIDTTGLSDFGDGSTLRLLVDGDGTFASGATTVTGTYSAPYFTVASQAIANGSYYTLGSNRSFYSVTYNANNANSGTAPDAQTKTQGIDLTLATNSGTLTKTNYTIAGWNTAADGSGMSYAAGATYSTEAALALFAKWTALPSNSTAVTAYGQSGSFTTGTSNMGGVTANSLNGPAGLVVDGSGNVYLADSVNNRVLYFPAGSTTAARVYGQNGDMTTSEVNNGGVSANSLSDPQALALDGSGNLYVADNGNHRVLYYPAGTTTATRVYGQDDFTSNAANKGGSISASSLNAPAGLALDASNNLYVADCYNNRVLYYPAGSTTATRVYGQGGIFTTGDANNGGAISANSLKSPFGIALNASGGLLVADMSNNRVLAYPAGTTTATAIYGQGGDFTTGTNNKGGISADSLSMPFAVVVDGSGGLLVADMNNNRVLGYPVGSTTATRVYGQGCIFTTGTANKGGLSANSLKAPAGLALDGSGNLYVSDQQNHRVLKYDHTLPQAYAVTYDGNGSDAGTTPVDSGSPYLAGSTVTVLANTYTKSGYNFAGWYPAADGSGTVYGASFVMGTANTTLYAKWTAPLPTYAVTYNANDATSGTAPGTQTKTQGTDLTLATNTGSLTKTGSPFAGWNTAADGSGTSYAAGATYSIDADVTLYAKWTALSTYAVTYNANNPTTGTAPDAQTKTQGIDLTLATNSGSLAKDGYTFAGWNTVADGSGATYSAGATYTTDATLALYANWTAVPLGMTPPGNALVFNGTDQSVSLPASLAKDVGDTEAITIEYWFKGSQLQSPVRFQDDNGYIVAGWGASGPKHIISTDGGTDNGLTVGDEGIVENGEWHHLAMTWERNTPNGFKSYLDGILVAQRDSADDALPPLSDATPYLGAFNGSSEFLAGHMDEVRIWNVVRTVTEINNNMRVELTGSESGLVAYYSFNEITGTSLPDVTGKGHTGTLTNMSDANWVASTVPFDTSKAYVTATATGNGSGTVSSSTGGLSYSYPATHSGATSAIAKAEGVILTATAGTISTASWTTCTGGTIVGNGTATATCTFSTLDGNKTATVTFTRPPATLYVDKGATGSNNGSSWANAYTDLQSALTASGSTDTILVAQGGYKPTSGTDRTVSFQLKAGVSIYGGYPTGGTGSRTPKTYVTTLSGDIGTEGDSSDNSYAVVNGSGTDNTAILDGFTISGGNANHFDNRTPGDYGAGMYNNAGSPKVQNVTFSNNRATYNGGGMYNERGSNPVIIDVTFADNSAYSGGGMFNDSSNPTLTNVTFSNNFTLDSGDGKGDGGGLYNIWSSPSLTNVTFSGNSANRGGGIKNVYSDSKPTLMNVTFSNNRATYNGGGAMYSHQSTPTLTNCILWGNSPDQINGYASTPTVTYSVVQGGYTGTGNLSSDPLLGTLGSYGGYTQTMPLLTGSPAIDAGTATGAPVTDQRGVARPKGAGCDIGAFELDITAVAPTVASIVAASAYPVAAINVTITGTNFTGTPVVTLQKSGYTTIQATNVVLNSTTELTCTLDISGAITGLRDVFVVNPDGLSGVKSNGFTVLDTPRGNVYVDKNNSGGNHDGSSWANAFTDLAGILPSAQSGDTIHVAQGTYKPTAGADRTKTFLLKDGVTLLGGYQAGGASRDAKTYPVILSGDLLGNDNSVVTKDEATRSENSYHVVTRSGTAGNSATLDGFTVSGGNANGDNSIGYGNISYGGGLYNEGDGNLTLKDVAVSNNSAIYGGGLFNRGNGTLGLTNITLSNNTAYYDGGGVYASNSTNTLTNVTFSGNTVSAANGGGMYFDSCASSTLMNVTFSGNTSSGGSGGGIYSFGDNSLIITNSILWGSSPNEFDYQGNDPTVTYSFVPDGFTGEGNLTADPLLGPLGNYGGSTPTIPLQAGSPAINAGTATGAPSTDQRGTARPQGSGYDIGAYEYVVATTYAVTYNVNGGTGTAPGTQTKTQGINLILAANSGNLAKTNYTFAGWNTAADGSGTSYATGAAYSTDAALVLFARWTANDSDGDGLPDWWELKYHGSATAMSAGGNTDGSGMSNLTKYAFGLDPTKGSSVNPIIDTTALHGAGQFSYTRAANSTLTYTVWTSTDLSDWGAVPAAVTQVTRVPAVDGVETVDITLTGYTPPPGGKLFVRVKAAQ